MSTRPEIEGGQRQRGYWEKVSGIKESLLCSACEGRFSRYENYFRDFFYGNSPPPLKKLSVGTPLDLSRFIGLDPDILGAKLLKVDYAQFKLFVLSLIWRASVAKGNFFEKVDLGAHESRIAALLKAENPGPDNEYPITILDLRHGTYGFEDLVQQPDYGKDGAQRGYSFVIGGFMLIIFVGALGHLPPDPVAKFCLKSSGELILVISKAGHILQWWATGLKRAGKI
jgi:hypothetical protein